MTPYSENRVGSVFVCVGVININTTAPPEKTALTRVVFGVEVPATGVWDIPPATASIHFTLRRPGARALRGHVCLADGVILIAADPRESVAAISLDASSLQASGRRRTRLHAKWLAAHRHPTIDLLIDAVEQQTRWEWTALGRLRLRDSTTPVALCFTYDGIDDAGGAMFRARTSLTVADLGLFRRWSRWFTRSLNVDVRVEMRARRVADLATFARDLRHPSSFVG
ncbi:MAG: YceI family protein [Acidimicrobiales bacterium]